MLNPCSKTKLILEAQTETDYYKQLIVALSFSCDADSSFFLDFQGRLKQNFKDIGSFEEHWDEDLDVLKTETSWKVRVGIITNKFQSL